MAPPPGVILKLPWWHRAMRFIRLHPWIIVAATVVELAAVILDEANSEEERAAAPDNERSPDDFVAYHENLATILAAYDRGGQTHAGAQPPSCCLQPAACSAPACGCSQRSSPDLVLDVFTEALIEERAVERLLNPGGGTCSCARS